MKTEQTYRVKVFDAGAGDDSGAVAEEVWPQGRGQGGV